MKHSRSDFFMLSRVADSIYWMARYVERAENLARFIDVTPGALDEQQRRSGWGRTAAKRVEFKLDASSSPPPGNGHFTPLGPICR